jgi:hypothetical protein
MVYGKSRMRMAEWGKWETFWLVKGVRFMAKTFRFMMLLALITCLIGCKKGPAACTVTQYGARHMIYEGSGEEFNEACRSVLHALGYKEKIDENKTRRPYHGEGVSTNKDGDRLISSESYMKTKDANGVEYKITTLTLGKRDPVVILETIDSDSHKLGNALNVELHKRGIRVVRY